MKLNVNWSYPTSIRFGAGRIAELPAACSEAEIDKPLLVTDKRLVELPITQSVLDILEAAKLGRAVFAEVEQNPSELNLNAGIEFYKKGGYDGIIAFGGGSSLDLGKSIAFMAGQTRAVWDFEDVDDWWMRADIAAIAPSVAVPTTAGTGSEIGRAVVISNSYNHAKKIIFHPKMMPKVAICDPQLTVGMPPVITAGTGLDAFTHCLEAFCSPHYHPMSQAIALEGMRLVKDNLLRCYTKGGDLEARAHMMSAALMGSVALQKGLGAIHALSHPIGAMYGAHHGTINAVVLPPVLKFNRPEIEAKINQIANHLDIKGGFDGFYEFTIQLNQQLGIPKNLTELGVKSSDIDQLIESTLQDPSVGGNPVQMTAENTKVLFTSCF